MAATTVEGNLWKGSVASVAGRTGGKILEPPRSGTQPQA